MALIKKEGELTYLDKLIFLGVLRIFLHTLQEDKHTNKYKKLFIKKLDSLNKKDKAYVASTVNGILDVYADSFEGAMYENSIVIKEIILMDSNILNSLGFNTSKFLALEVMKKVHPSVEAGVMSRKIVKHVEESLEEHGLIVKRLIPKKEGLKMDEITRCMTAGVSLDINYNEGKFVPTVKLKSSTLIYMQRVLIYTRLEGVEYTVKDEDVVGLGGDLVSNMLPHPNKDDTVIGIKRMDDETYIFTNKASDPDIAESHIDIPEGYRYTIEVDNFNILIHRWLNKTEYLDTYSIMLVDLLTTGPIVCKKKLGYKHKPIPQSIYRKAGLKSIDHTKSYIDDGTYVLVKNNGNAITFKDGKKVKLFTDTIFVLDADTANPVYKDYQKHKILL